MGNNELPEIQYMKDGCKVFSVPYYDVGDFFETTNPKNPSERWDYGTWELYGKGKMTICIDSADSDFNAIGKTGGSKNHNHNAGTLGACYDPKNPYNNTTFKTKYLEESYELTGYISESRGSTSGGGSSTKGIDVIGHTEESNNMPPYIVVYRWIRTA